MVSQPTREYGRDTLRSPVFLSFSSYTVLVVFLLSLVASRHKILSCDILAQIQCDICDSSLYEIDCLRDLLNDLPFAISVQLADRTLIIAKRV